MHVNSLYEFFEAEKNANLKFEKNVIEIEQRRNLRNLNEPCFFNVVFILHVNLYSF